MLRRSVLALTLTLGLSAAATPAAQAAESYCTPSGDYCTSAAKTNGVRTLRLSTFSFRGKVDICVKATGATRVCKTRTLHGHNGLWSVSIRWSTNYPRQPKGTRRVSFISHEAGKIGPTLTFQAR